MATLRGSPASAKGALRRQQALEAALACISERGIHDTRIADVAVRAGMSPGHVLYYFGSKQRLLAEVLSWNEDRFHEHLAAELARARTARQRLERLIRASVPTGRGDPHWLLWLEVWSNAPHDLDLLADQERQEARFRSLLEQVLAQGQASGEFDLATEPASAAVRLSALIDGLAVQVVIGAPAMDPRRMRRIALDEVASIVGSPPGAS